MQQPQSALDQQLAAMGAYGQNSAAPQAAQQPMPPPTPSPMTGTTQNATSALDGALQSMGAYNQQGTGQSDAVQQAAAQAGIHPGDPSVGSAFSQAVGIGIGKAGNWINKHFTAGLVPSIMDPNAIKSYEDDLDLQQQQLSSTNPLATKLGVRTGQAVSSMVDAGALGTAASAVASGLGAGSITSGAVYLAAQGATMGAQATPDGQSIGQNALIGAGTNLALGLGSKTFSAISPSWENYELGKQLKNMDANGLVNNVIQQTLQANTGSIKDLQNLGYENYKKVVSASIDQGQLNYQPLYSAAKAQNIIPGKANLSQYVGNLIDDAQNGSTPLMQSVISTGKLALGDTDNYGSFSHGSTVVRNIGAEAAEAYNNGNKVLGDSLTKMKAVAQMDIDSSLYQNPDLYNGLKNADAYMSKTVYPLASMAGGTAMYDKLTASDFIDKVNNGLQSDPKMINTFNSLPTQAQANIRGALVAGLKQGVTKDGVININAFANVINKQAQLNPLLQPMASKFSSIADNMYNLGAAQKALNLGKSGWLGAFLGTGLGTGMGAMFGGAEGGTMGALVGGAITPSLKRAFVLNAAGKMINNPGMRNFLDQYSDIATGGAQAVKDSLSKKIGQGMMSVMSSTLQSAAQYQGTQSALWVKQNMPQLGFPDDQDKPTGDSQNSVASLGVRD